jgi:hypothetical protein
MEPLADRPDIKVTTLSLRDEPDAADIRATSGWTVRVQGPPAGLGTCRIRRAVDRAVRRRRRDYETIARFASTTPSSGRSSSVDRRDRRTSWARLHEDAADTVGRSGADSKDVAQLAWRLRKELDEQDRRRHHARCSR